MNDKAHISNFIKDIFENNYAGAKASLQAAVVEKMKLLMKEQIVPKTDLANKQGE